MPPAFKGVVLITLPVVARYKCRIAKDGNQWYFYDNNGSTAFNNANQFNTGLDLVVGRVYSLTFDVDPNTGIYDASIDDGVNPIVTATGLTFRRGVGNAGSVNSFHINTTRNAPGDNVAYSIDNLTIVPEPSTLALSVLGLAGLVIARRRVR